MKHSSEVNSDSVGVKTRRSGLDRLAIWLIALTVLFLVLSVVKLFFHRENPQSATAPTPPFTDFRSEKPGAVHKITAKDLPAPYATSSRHSIGRALLIGRRMLGLRPPPDSKSNCSPRVLMSRARSQPRPTAMFSLPRAMLATSRYSAALPAMENRSRRRLLPPA